MEEKDTENDAINFLSENDLVLCNDLQDIGKCLRGQAAKYCINSFQRQ